MSGKKPRHLVASLGGHAPPGRCLAARLFNAPPCIMGILNCTPDSFSDGATLKSLDAALARAHAHVNAGAAVLDIGGESTRPGAKAVSSDEQMRRVLPLLEALAQERFDVLLSIDTSDATVAEAAIDRGVGLVNDVTGLRSRPMRALVARTGVQAVVMHMRGNPSSMQNAAHSGYKNVVDEVRLELGQALEVAMADGIAASQLWLDLGLGFAKQAAHNWQLIRHLGALCRPDVPMLVGPSRKGFIADAVERSPDQRDKATAALCTVAVMNGAQMVRVHDVEAVRDAVAIGYALRAMS